MVKRGPFVVAVLLVAGLVACTRNRSETTETTTPTTPSPVVPTPPPTPPPATPTVPPAQTIFTVSGTITGSDTNQPLAGAEIEALDGPNAGTKYLANASGVYSITGLGAGTFTLRIRAAGYVITDQRPIITDADVTFNIIVVKTPTPPPAVLRADFFQTPSPCTITGVPAVVDCKVDANGSTSPVRIVTYSFSYLGITNVNVVQGLLLTCGDGPERELHIPVTLTITDADGNQSSVTKSVTAVKIGACGF